MYPRKPGSRDDFQVAIICALTLEANAVLTLFDHHYDSSYIGKARGDPNSYSIGIIAGHNVVLAHLPNMGTIAAGNIAAFCNMSFTKIRLALVVGVCGGVPMHNGIQIRLGDVIVSTGIIQYDFGRRFPDKFEIKDTLNEAPGRPNLEIRGLISKIATTIESDRLRNSMRDLLDQLHQGSETSVKYPGRSKDILFPPDYRHKHYDSPCIICASCQSSLDQVCSAVTVSNCDDLNCDSKKQLQRFDQSESQKTSLYPNVHFGLFASGNSVMKSGEDRDQLARQKQVIGFEMESAGVWDVFPCIVIKGVCDYADSHKSKEWQEYAAMSASACSKTILGYWNSMREIIQEEIEANLIYERVLSSLRYPEINERKNSIASTAPKIFEWILNDHLEDISSDISEEFSDSRDAASGDSSQNEQDSDLDWSDTESLQDASCEWSDFIGWLQSDQPIYWIQGKPGSGKSTLMKFLLSDPRTTEALRMWQAGCVTFSHFFWLPGEPMQHSLKGFLCSIIYQILSYDKDFLKHNETFDSDKVTPGDWDQRTLQDLLLDYLDRCQQPICIFIDALDEVASEDDTNKLLQLIHSLSFRGVKMCVSSRPERLIQLHLNDVPGLKIHDFTLFDMVEYAEGSMKTFVVHRSRDLSFQSLAMEIARSAEGVFLWAVLVTRSLIRGLNNGDSKDKIYRRLNDTPRDLMDLYRDVLKRSTMDRQLYHQDASLLFNLFLVDARCSLFELTMAADNELLESYVVQGAQLPYQAFEKKCQDLRKFLSVGCAGLLEVKMDPMPHLPQLPQLVAKQVSFIHRSARDFLMETEDGTRLRRGCDLSHEELLNRRYKGLLAKSQLTNRLGSKSYFWSTEQAIRHLLGWEKEEKLRAPHLGTLLDLASSCYIRGDLINREHAYKRRHLAPVSIRGQFLVLAASLGLWQPSVEELETLDETDKVDTAYSLFHNACIDVSKNDYKVMNASSAVNAIRYMLTKGYSPNCVRYVDDAIPRSSSPWVEYLLKTITSIAVHSVWDVFEDEVSPSLAWSIWEIMHMFLRKGASLYPTIRLQFLWQQLDITTAGKPPEGRTLSSMDENIVSTGPHHENEWDRFGTLYLNIISSSSNAVRPIIREPSLFIVVDVNAKLLVQSILVQLHKVAYPVAPLSLAVPTSQLRIISFGTSWNGERIATDSEITSKKLEETLNRWFSDTTTRRDNGELDSITGKECFNLIEEYVLI